MATREDGDFRVGYYTADSGSDSDSLCDTADFIPSLVVGLTVKLLDATEGDVADLTVRTAGL